MNGSRPPMNGGAMLRFVLDGRRREFADADPCRTLLDHLRLVERRTGTKEGCGEGDCGACAVILCDRDGTGAPRLRAVNSCLLPLPAVDSTHVITVEGLAEGDALHPVQEQMVALHASQCGFCTPGFVMALAAFTANDEAGDGGTGHDAAIHDALAGNLCRCTGYRPIVDAARVARESGRRWWESRLPAFAEAADTMAPARATPLPGWFAPQSVTELGDLLARMPEARIVAGATDLGLAIAKQGLRPPALVSVNGVAAMRGIAIGPDAVRIGAAATLAEMLPALDPLYPGLGTLLRRFGSRQVRNLATLGGNLCNASPIGDLAPVLLALDATVHIGAAQGGRALAIAEFFTGYRRTALAPGEFLEAATLPRLAANERFRVYKLSKRYDQDISTVCAAIRLRLEGNRIAAVRLAFGGMAATPRRAPHAEAALAGRPFGADAIEQAAAALAEDFAPIDDARGSGAFRRIAAANLLRRFWLEMDSAAAAGGESGRDARGGPLDVMAL